MKRLMIKGLFLLAVLGFICGPIFIYALSASAAENPINIGVSCAFSGIVAEICTKEFKIIEMAVNEVNVAGGINGRPIKIFAQDNGSDPTQAVGVLKMLKDLNKCVAINQLSSSSVAIAAMAWAEQNHVLIMAPDPMTDKVWKKEGKAWLFRTYNTVVNVEACLSRIKQLGYDNVAYAGTTLAWGTDVLALLKEIAPNYGIKVVGEVLCEPKSKDLTIQALALRKTGAKAVLCSDYEAETGVWARAINSIGWKPYTIHVSGAVFVASFAINPVELFEGWETLQIVDVGKPMVKQIWNKYEQYTGKREETEIPCRAWDFWQLLMQAIKLSGNPDDPLAIREGVYKIKDFPIVVGRPQTLASFAIGRNHLLTVKDIPIWVVKSGKLAVAH